MYDYVIVGAGSAGCVLASRLIEDPDVSVLLIEAGPPDTIENIHVPAAFAQLLHSQLDWDYSTGPEPFADRRRIHLPRGKTLGGSSSLNWMVYIRGHRADYDEWRDQGCEGWGYDDLLPYFIRAEDNERGASQYHGTGGPLTVSDGRSRNPITEAFLHACDQDGLAAQRGLQRRRAGRLWALPGDPARRPALLDRGGLSAPGDVPGEPDRRDVHAGPSRAVRGRPSGRGARRAAGRDGRATRVSRRARSDPVRRRVQLAATADAVRRRVRRAVDGLSDPGRGRPAHGRAEPPRPLGDRPAVDARRARLAAERSER